ncbi:NrfD/PsrC family molybdoenzyme membrane anchor subunit [Streptomyces sp. NPDC060027]|uniref:NrfD/PsrC family molybdoenzyme membrane anchor subunit n=1 Tax=Streptomyces sp. NPDC060027 TaxID=3347040 RepID=UPI0036A6ACEC
MKVSSLAAVSLPATVLVHDLGRPGRFVNMLRVFKPTSPMSMGSWLLTPYGPAAGVALPRWRHRARTLPPLSRRSSRR